MRSAARLRGEHTRVDVDTDTRERTHVHNDGAHTPMSVYNRSADRSDARLSDVIGIGAQQCCVREFIHKSDSYLGGVAPDRNGAQHTGHQFE